MLSGLSVELQVVLFSVILGIIELLVATQAATAQRGTAWNMGMREGPQKELTGMAGRLDRAFKNFRETYAFFLAAALVVHLSGKTNSLSEWGAVIYLVFRILHFLVYAAGIKVLRTLVWLGSMAGIVMILIAAF